MWLTLFAGSVTAILGILLLTALSNALFFPRLRPASAATAVDVAVLVPARNESATIGATVRALRDQEVDGLRLRVLNDGSTDGTAREAQQAAAGDLRFRLLTGDPLPDGWLGKNWACRQLADSVDAAWLLFADADVIWAPGAVAALLAFAAREEADMVTVWPTQKTITWAERLVVPLMSLAIVAYLPVLAVHYLPWAAFAAANGQCLLLRRTAYERVGGHAAVAGNIVEDVALARLIKRTGLRLRMIDGNGLIGCRMYDSWPAVRHGFGKNILAGHGNSVAALLLSTLLHWTLFLGPWLWLAAGLSATGRSSPGWPLWPLALIACGWSLRLISAAVTRQRLADALLLPVSVLLMTLVAAQALQWRFSGGPRWKGRVARG